MRRSISSFFAPVLLAGVLLGGSATLVGCEDPKSMEWQLKHLDDGNGKTRAQALEGISATWKAIDQSNDEKKKGEFRDKSIEALANAYKSDVLKDQSRDRKRILDILVGCDDKRARSAFLSAIKRYDASGNVDDEVRITINAIRKNKADYKGDDEIGKALVEALKKVKFSVPKNGELGAAFGDVIGAIKPKAAVGDLLNILQEPNSGLADDAGRNVSGRQAVAAIALGEIADPSAIGQMVDAMFALAGLMPEQTDKESGDKVKKASQSTTAIAMVISNSLAKFGEPVIAVLMPYVKDDVSNPKVKEAKDKFKEYITAYGAGAPTFYVTLATNTIANIGLPAVSKEVATIVEDPKTKDADRKAMLGLIFSLPADDIVVNAVKKGYELSAGAPKLRGEIAVSVSRTMSLNLVDWCFQSIDDLPEYQKKGKDVPEAIVADIRRNFLMSLIFLVPKDKADQLREAFKKAPAVGEKEKKALIDSPDPMWTVKVHTAEECDPEKLKDKEKELCYPHPDEKKADGKDKFVKWKDATPTYSEELTIVKELLDKCDKDPKCYFEKFKENVKLVDEEFTKGKASRAATEARIRTQKALWMLSAYGDESDMATLIGQMPLIAAPPQRGLIQIALDRNLKNGSIKVADVISKLIADERKKASDTSNRTASELEPIANKLRLRVSSAKK